MRRFPISVWLFALTLALLTSLPYIAGLLSTPEGWLYSGAPAVPTGVAVDFNSHMAKLWQGSRGQLDYQLLFTHETHLGLPLVQGFYVILGLLAGFTPFGLPLIYHVTRFVLIVCMVLAIWAFSGRFFEKKRERWLATLFGTVVSGWSWLLLFIDPAMTAQVSPIEFWLTDAFNLLGGLFMPHFAAAVTLQIVAVLTFDDWVRSKGASARRLITLTLTLAALSIIQPYGIVLFGALLVILAAYHVFSAKRLSLWRALWLVIPLGIYGGLTVYQYVAISSDPVWAQFSAQNQTLSPLVTYYLLGYLPFIIPIALGARRFMVDRADDRWWIPIIWVALVAMLLYGPFPTQRRYLLGVQTPLAILAAYGWSQAILPRFRRKVLVTAVYVTLAGVALMGIVFANATALMNPTKTTAAFYNPDELLGYAWLQREASPNDLVLTTFDLRGQGSGGRLVAAIGQRVFIGHWFETADFANKVQQVERFYDPATPDSWRQDFLKQVGAVYIWYDEYARALGDWNPADADYLEAVFASERVTIYRFNP